MMTESEGRAARVKVDGEDAVLHITDQSVMFEKDERVTGFMRSAIQMVKPDGDAMIIAYSAGSEVKSVRVEPITAVASLVVPDPQHGAASAGPQSPASAFTLDETFERLYREARRELEKKLVKVQQEPENNNLRLTSEEENGYSRVSRQMENIMGAKYEFDPQNPLVEERPITFWGLEKRPYEFQLGVVKILHIQFLRMLVSPKAERNDILYSATEVWPEDWERILVKFRLSERPFLTDKFKGYLESHWEYHPGDRKPVLARS